MSVQRKQRKDEETKTGFFVLKKLLPYALRHKGALGLSLLLAIAAVVMQLYIPILFGKAIDHVVAAGKVDFAGMWIYLRRILFFAVAAALATWWMNLLNNRITYGILRDLRSQAMAHIQKLPLAYLDKHSSGDIVSRIVTDTDVIADGLLLGFSQLFAGVVTILMTLVFMFSTNVPVSGIVVVLTPLSFLVAAFISRRSYRLFKEQSAIRGKQVALINEMVGNQKVVKAFGYGDRASARFGEINDALTKCSRLAVFYSSLANPSTRFVNNLVYAGVALVGVLLIPGGSLTVGGLSALLAYANQYMKPFNDISAVVTELQNTLACANRVFELLEAPSETPDAPEGIAAVKGQVDFSHVSFSYDPERPLIEDLNLQISPGMRVAIVGPTGCGKTTLINLLMRFYDVNDGSIALDGTPIDQISRHALRSSFGMVLQETWLKNGTVRENICFGRPDAAEEDIIAAAKAAHCWEFIQRLPAGLDTVLTENSLSQGQKQLLCIARVILCRPPMLILDEATSSIDTHTEMQIQKAFDALMEGRTSFVVAHRLSTIRDASLILVMKDGKVVERGVHSELVGAGGVYSKLSLGARAR